MVNQIVKARHLPNQEESRVLHLDLRRKRRKVLEALYVNRNQRMGDVVWEDPTVGLCNPRSRMGTNQRPELRFSGAF